MNYHAYYGYYEGVSGCKFSKKYYILDGQYICIYDSKNRKLIVKDVLRGEQ